MHSHGVAPESGSQNRNAGAPWVVVSHDMAQMLRQTDMTIDSSPWRFIFQIRGVQGLPSGINHVAVSWKTRLAQAHTRLCVGSSSSSSSSSSSFCPLSSYRTNSSVFERGCLIIDTGFAVDPLANKADAVTRDKMLMFSVKGYRVGEDNAESEVRIGSFSFRCMQAICDTAVGQPSRVFRIAVDSPGLPRQHERHAVVSLRVKCFPLWMAPAFGNEFDESAVEAPNRIEGQLNDTLAKLSFLSQEYVASRSLLSRGCSDGSVALLDPIFRSPLNLAAQELLFPNPPFPKCVVDSSFSAVMAPALLQESITVNICKVHKLNSALHVQRVRKKIETAAAFIEKNADDALCNLTQVLFKLWAKLCQHSRHSQRLHRCAHFLNVNCRR
jgi:hypothetical protein